MDQEIEIGLSKDGERVDPSHFDLLKVLGQGSFGKVRYFLSILVIYYRKYLSLHIQ